MDLQKLEKISDIFKLIIDLDFSRKLRNISSRLVNVDIQDLLELLTNHYLGQHTGFKNWVDGDNCNIILSVPFLSTSIAKNANQGIGSSERNISFIKSLDLDFIAWINHHLIILSEKFSKTQPELVHLSNASVNLNKVQNTTSQHLGNNIFSPSLQRSKNLDSFSTQVKHNPKIFDGKFLPFKFLFSRSMNPTLTLNKGKYGGAQYIDKNKVLLLALPLKDMKSDKDKFNSALAVRTNVASEKGSFNPDQPNKKAKYHVYFENSERFPGLQKVKSEDSNSQSGKTEAVTPELFFPPVLSTGYKSNERQVEFPNDIHADFLSRYFNFPSIRIHTDFIANNLAQSLNADALTIGRDIFFARDKPNLAKPEDIALLGHELTHVKQQMEIGQSIYRNNMSPTKYQTLESQALANESSIKEFFSTTPMLSSIRQRHDNSGFFINRITASPAISTGTFDSGTKPKFHFATVPQLKSTSGSMDIPSISSAEGVSQVGVGEEQPESILTTTTELGVDQIAEKVYSLIKRKLYIDLERRGKCPV